MKAWDRRQLLRAGALVGAGSAWPALARVAPPAPDAAAAAVQALLDGHVTNGRLVGAAASLGRGTEPARFLAAGRQSREAGTAMGADSLFRIYSMTKPITGIAAAMLIEDERLRLDQPVADFIPGFAHARVATDPLRSLAAVPARAPVTIRGLLTHSAGLGYAITVKGALLDAYIEAGLTGGYISALPIPGVPPIIPAPSLAAFADRIAALPLLYQPGTRWSYSAGLDVMGRVIEIASGMSFPDFLRTRLFEPLGMASTFFIVPSAQVGRMTTNYGVLGQTQLPIDLGTTTIFATAGRLPLGGSGLVSSPRDYDRFLQMLAGEGAIGAVRVMRAETARLAMSNLLPPGVDTRGTMADGQGFGAGGRVTINPGMAGAGFPGAGLGTFGWGGAAATIAFVDPTRRVRAGGFAQFMPDQAMPFTRGVAAAIYSAL